MFRINASAPDTWPVRILLPFFLLLVLATYSHTLYSPLVLDDTASFVEMREVYINDFSLDSLKQLASTRFGMARFLPLLSFAVDHRLNPGSIVQFHITNIVIHLLATLALFAFLTGIMRFEAGRRTLRTLSPAHFCLFVAVLWALHPVQTNAVTYLVQRMTSMAAMFYLAALACYVHGRAEPAKAKRLVLHGAAACLALGAFLSKENSFTLPFAILLFETIFLMPAFGAWLRQTMTGFRLLAVGLLLLLLLPFAAQYLGNATTGYEIRSFTMLERLLTEPRILVFYLSLLALPLPGRLNLDHDFSLSTSLPSPPTTLLAMGFLLALLLIGVRLRRREPLIAFAILWYFLHLVIESSIIPLELIFEHRLYLPSVGFVIVVVAGVDRACAYCGRHKMPTPGRMAILSLVILACLSSLLTSVRNHTWRDASTLYADSLRKSPTKPRALVNYGFTLLLAEEYDKAIPYFERAIALGRPGNEEYVKAANNILAALISQKKYEEAVAKGMAYLADMPAKVNGAGYAKFMYTLGFGYYKLGRFEEALGAFNRGLMQQNGDERLFLRAIYDVYEIALSSELEGTVADAQREAEVNLRAAAFMLRFKRYDNARLFLDETLAIDPESREAAAFKEQLQSEIAVNNEARRSADLTQNVDYRQNVPFRWAMSTATFLLRYRSPAFKRMAGPLLAMAQELQPDNPFVAARMIEYYLALDDFDKALAIAEKAIEQHEHFPPLLDLTGRIYFDRGDRKRAALVYRQLLDIYPGHPRWRDYEGLILNTEPPQSPTSEKAAIVSPPTSQS